MAGLPALEAGAIAELAGVGSSVIRGLAAEGVLERIETQAVQRFGEPDFRRAGLDLTADQRVAADTLCRRIAAAGHSVTLIDGVTGSGKTEVYFEAIARIVAAGRQVLLLVPEIALTQQFIDRIEDRFGARPAEWHSGVRPRERERVWRAVSLGGVAILVGARSALFLPWRNLGLIVVDEEHEGAFKQEDGVPYHARDMAVVYGALGAFPVILSSATPSLETLANVNRSRYGVVTLKGRIGRASLPQMALIDMRAERTAGGRWLAEALVQAVGETLARGEQALLFLNRRGYAPLTLCRRCGFRIDCPNCSSTLVEHRFKRAMLCHHCGHHAADAKRAVRPAAQQERWCPAGRGSSGLPRKRKNYGRRRVSSSCRAISFGVRRSRKRCARSPPGLMISSSARSSWPRGIIFPS